MQSRRYLLIVPVAVLTLTALAWLALLRGGNPPAAPTTAALAERPTEAATSPALPTPQISTAAPSATPGPTSATSSPALPTPTLAGDVPVGGEPPDVSPPTPEIATSPATTAATSPAATSLPGEALPTPAPGAGPRPALPPLAVDPAGPVVHGPRDAPRIALTFDACQDPDLPAGYDDALIQVLLDTHTPATLFLGGDWMRTHPEQTRFLAAQPLFELGNHGYAHIDFAAATIEAMGPEIEEVQQTMWELVGRQPRVFRFPGGTYTAEALEVAAALGVRPIEWEVVSGDPDPDITAERMIPWVVNQVQNGSIIIMHMNGRGWHTAEALPAIIAQLKEQGFEFVTVSELLGEE